LPVDDPSQRCPDITKARQLLNWQPTIQLEEGMRKTINDLKSRISDKTVPDVQLPVPSATFVHELH
jgi:UDP-glucuronate decarboxylase